MTGVKHSHLCLSKTSERLKPRHPLHHWWDGQRYECSHGFWVDPFLFLKKKKEKRKEKIAPNFLNRNMIAEIKA